MPYIRLSTVVYVNRNGLDLELLSLRLVTVQVLKIVQRTLAQTEGRIGLLNFTADNTINLTVYNEEEGSVLQQVFGDYDSSSQEDLLYDVVAGSYLLNVKKLIRDITELLATVAPEQRIALQRRLDLLMEVDLAWVYDNGLERLEQLLAMETL